jgi:DNA polymerase V
MAKPLFFDAPSAGAVNSDDSYEKIGLDISEVIAPQKESTFYMSVASNSMSRMGIHKEDIIVIDRGLNPSSGSVVVAFVNNQFVVKQYNSKKGKKFLEDSFGNKINLNDNDVIEIWGVVTYSVHSLM